MNIECIKVGDLEAWTRSAAFRQLTVLPISRRRARSHACNPRAREEDVALVLAYLEQKLVGYLGMLPDAMIHDGQAKRFAWMSCIWVDPNTRGKGVAKALLRRGYEEWDQHLLATEFTAPAKSLYDKLGWFAPLTEKEGLRLYLRFNLAQLLPAKKPKLSVILPLLQLSDGFLNVLNAVRLAFVKQQVPETMQIQTAKQLSENDFQFIEKKQEEEFSRRGRAELNWILENPWLGSEAEDQEDAKGYHFSVYSPQFQFVVLRLQLHQETIAVLILSLRDQALKVPYAWFDAQQASMVTLALSNYMLSQDLSILTLYQADLVAAFQKKSAPFFHKRTFKRPYLVTHRLQEQGLPVSIHLQDGDGDCAFT